MRSMFWARWATCALAITVAFPLAVSFADTKKSVNDCTAFDQTNKGEDAVQFTLHNTCSVGLSCTINWQVTCVSRKKVRTVHPGSITLALVDTTVQTAEASASVCAADSWSIGQVQWSCQPNRD
jgi:hypothetical protein